MSSIRCGVGFSGNFLLEAPPPSPWKRTPGGGELGGRGGAGSGRGGAPILQVLSGRLGPAQARPSLPQGRGESGGYGGERGTRAALLQAVDPSKSCAQTSFSLLLSSAGLAIELERGRDLRTKYQAKCQLPFLAVPCAVGGSGFILRIGAQTFWTVLGHQSASPEPRGEAQPRPQTGTWHAAVRFALDGCFYFRGLRE